MVSPRPRRGQDVQKDGPRDAFFRTVPDRLLQVLRCLRDDPTLRFGFLQNLTAVDWPKAPPAGRSRWSTTCTRIRCGTKRC